MLVWTAIMIFFSSSAGFAYTIPCTVSVNVILLPSSSVSSRSIDIQSVVHPGWQWKQLAPWLKISQPGTSPSHVNFLPGNRTFVFEITFTLSSSINSEKNLFIVE